MHTLSQNQKDKSSPWFLIVLFVVFPYISLLDNFVNLRVFNVSFLYLLVISLLFFYFLFLAKKKRYYFQDLLMIICLTFIVLLLRLLIGIDTEFSNPVAFLNKARWIFLIPVMIVLCREIFRRTKNINIIKMAIISSGVISALVAIGYYYGIHSFRILPSDVELRAIIESGEVTRVSGIWSGSNFYGGMLILSLWMLLEKKINIFTMPFIFILYYGILLSISRLPIIFASLLILFYFFHYRKSKKFILTIILTSLLMFVFIGIFSGLLPLHKIYGVFSGIRARIYTFGWEWESLVVSRVSKSLVGLKALFSRPSFMLLGTDIESLIDPLVERTKSSDLTFSDNSFIQGMVTVGIPVFLYFLYVCKRCFGKNFKNHSLKIYLFFIYILITLLTNNAILWDTWIFYAIMLYFLLNSNQWLTCKIYPKIKF